MNSLYRAMMAEVERLGMAARVVSIARLAELERDISGPRENGPLDKTLFDTFLAGFQFEVPAQLPDARYIVVLAHPEPVTMAQFQWAG